METCKDCICYEACHYHIDEETTMTVKECSTGFKHKDQYVKLPAYIGMEVWCIFYWSDRDPEIAKGKVSGLQQKADGSWKIRVSHRGYVSDYTIEEFEDMFPTEEAAKEYVINHPKID